MPPRLGAVLAELGAGASPCGFSVVEPAGRVVVRAQRCPRGPCCKRRCRRPDFRGGHAVDLGTSGWTGCRGSRRLDPGPDWRPDEPRDVRRQYWRPLVPRDDIVCVLHRTEACHARRPASARSGRRALCPPAIFLSRPCSALRCLRIGAPQLLKQGSCPASPSGLSGPSLSPPAPARRLVERIPWFCLQDVGSGW